MSSLQTAPKAVKGQYESKSGTQMELRTFGPALAKYFTNSADHGFGANP